MHADPNIPHNRHNHNPPGADQSSVGRLDEVLRYKVVRSMCSSSAGKGVSVCKVLGQRLLYDPKWPRLALWPRVEALVEAQLCQQGGGGGDGKRRDAAEVEAEAEAGRSFLRRFGETLSASGGVDNDTAGEMGEAAESAGGEDEDEEDEGVLAARLVWSGDFNGELSRLRERRRKQAAVRMPRHPRTCAEMPACAGF